MQTVFDAVSAEIRDQDTRQTFSHLGLHVAGEVGPATVTDHHRYRRPAWGASVRRAKAAASSSQKRLGAAVRSLRYQSSIV